MFTLFSLLINLYTHLLSSFPPSCGHGYTCTCMYPPSYCLSCTLFPYVHLYAIPLSVPSTPLALWRWQLSPFWVCQLRSMYLPSLNNSRWHGSWPAAWHLSRRSTHASSRSHGTYLWLVCSACNFFPLLLRQSYLAQSPRFAWGTVDRDSAVFFDSFVPRLAGRKWSKRDVMYIRGEIWPSSPVHVQATYYYLLLPITCNPRCLLQYAQGAGWGG